MEKDAVHFMENGGGGGALSIGNNAALSIIAHSTFSFEHTAGLLLPLQLDFSFILSRVFCKYVGKLLMFAFLHRIQPCCSTLILILIIFKLIFLSFLSTWEIFYK
jgi:hypothetical protein